MLALKFLRHVDLKYKNPKLGKPVSSRQFPHVFFSFLGYFYKGPVNVLSFVWKVFLLQVTGQSLTDS